MDRPRRNVDPVVSGTPGGAQGRSSWEGGAPKAQYRPKAGKKKKTHEVGLFFLVELQRIRFAGWALTEGQHRPKAGKKKKTREAGLFFLVPTSL